MTTLTGLTSTEAAKRLADAGPNEVPEPQFSFFKATMKRLWEPSAWILEAALILEIVLGKDLQAAFIALMLGFAALNGAIQEGRASRVLHELSHDLTVTVAVNRDNHWQTLSARDLVVGDLISLQPGDLLPADVQVLTATLSLDESTISGETAAVTHPVDSIAFAGTEVVNGQSLARVTATGAASRTGKTISLVKQASPNGHLQQLLGKIIGYLAILDSVLAVILIIAAVIRGENLIALLPFLAMLFIATIPIAMPSSFAVANAVEAKVLSQHHVLVSDLTGIQEAANLNLLLVDKTGTITANKPSVVAFQNTSTLTDDEVLALAVGATDERHPSVVDRAIQNAAAKTAFPASKATEYVPFTPGLGYSQATVTVDGHASKTVRLGAYRVLSAQAENTPTISREILSRGRSVAVLADNHLLGVYILQDQPRSTSRQAIADLQQRGIQVIMLTGDHQPSAATIAGEVGLSGQVLSFSDITDTTDISQLAGIADVVPENKLAITKQLQSAGYIVGMTGDGVNDAPALKQADVGIAVENAVDLAKQSARMVLMTPGLTPIVDILDSGHRVYQRIMTWAITKLSRTAELTLFLTLGYLWLGNIPLSLNAMVLVAILNDLVTLVLGTDNTVISHQPEQWNLKKLSRIAILLASGWTIVGFGLLAWLHVTGVTPGRISTLLFIYLIFSAMVTILMTRTTRHFWQSRPSNAVMTAIGGNCVLTLVLSWIGLGIAQVTVTSTLIVIVVVLLTGIGLSFLPLGNLANQN